MIKYSNDPNSIQKHGKSFYWASFFLPKKNKKIASELYGICRFFDDLADKNDDDQTKVLSEEFKKICRNFNHPINIFFRSHNISINVLGDLIDGLIRDQKKYELKMKKN